MTRPLSEALRERTGAAHRRVEDRPFVRALIGGRLERSAYCLLLRSLHEIYAALEAGLARHAGHPGLAPLQAPALRRQAALASDLDTLHGLDWPTRLAVQPAALAYAQRLHELGREHPEQLAAHAYVRYLGDLSGGQVLSRVVERAYALSAGTGTRFYAFDEPAAQARQLRVALDALGAAEGSAAIVDEAEAGFRRHEQLFDELERARGAGLSSAP